MQDRRKTARGRTYFGAEVDVAQRKSALACVVQNFSTDGAKLVFTGGAPAQNDFYLSIPKYKQTFPARLVWRRGNEAGVAFGQGQLQSAPISLDLVRRLRKCEAEKAALERRVKELVGYS